MSKEEAELIADVFLNLEACYVHPNGEITGRGGYYVALADAWNNFAERRL